MYGSPPPPGRRNLFLSPSKRKSEGGHQTSGQFTQVENKNGINLKEIWYQPYTSSFVSFCELLQISFKNVLVAVRIYDRQDRGGELATAFDLAAFRLSTIGFPWSPQLSCQSFENCSEHARNGLRTTTRSSSSQRFDSVKWIRFWSCWSLLSLL